MIRVQVCGLRISKKAEKRSKFIFELPHNSTKIIIYCLSLSDRMFYDSIFIHFHLILQQKYLTSNKNRLKTIKILHRTRQSITIFTIFFIIIQTLHESSVISMPFFWSFVF